MDDVTREVVLDAPPGRGLGRRHVPDQLAEWFGADVDGEIAPGEVVRFTSPDGSVRRALIERMDEPRELAFRWLPSATEPPSRVDITIDPAHDGSVLRVTSGGSRRRSAPGRAIGFNAHSRGCERFRLRVRRARGSDAPPRARRSVGARRGELHRSVAWRCRSRARP